jgi:hypothetical protein
MEEWEGKHEGERGERENNETETAIVKSFPPGPEVVGEWCGHSEREGSKV